MDNLTHGLLGAAIGMLRRRDGGPVTGSPPSHTDRAVPLACILAAEAPDIDVFFGSGPLHRFAYHRGLTHSLLFAPVIALAAAGLTKVIWGGANVRTVFRWSLAAVLVGHLVNDWMTGWGTRLLLPFSSARLSLDWVPMVDLLYTLPLLVAVFMASGRPHLQQKLARGILSYLAIYAIGFRGLSHALVEQAAMQQYAGQPVRRIHVSPDMINPLASQVTIDLGDRFEQGTAYPFGAIRVDRIVPRLPEDDVIRAVRRAPELKPFFDQFAYARVSYRKLTGGYEVTVGDVRYQYHEWGINYYQFRGRGINYRVLMNENLQVERIMPGDESAAVG